MFSGGMTPTHRKWLRRGLVAASPLLGGCFCGGGDCGTQRTVSWNGRLPDGGELTDAGLIEEHCSELCGKTESGISFNRCAIVADGGALDCHFQCVGGRAPPGLEGLSHADHTAGSWLARLAELEAAAVHAFSHLADELDTHHLSRFAEHALVAATEEVHHAQLATRLALKQGWCPQPLRLHATQMRTLEEVALDNAAEGCGRELFGAALNLHQARTAEDRDVATAMTSIARDELAHARFSFELANELMPKLTVAGRGRVREAQELALARLGADTVPDGSRRSLGLMDAEQSGALAKRLLDTQRL